MLTLNVAFLFFTYVFHVLQLHSLIEKFCGTQSDCNQEFTYDKTYAESVTFVCDVGACASLIVYWAVPLPYALNIECWGLLGCNNTKVYCGSWEPPPPYALIDMSANNISCEIHCDSLTGTVDSCVDVYFGCRGDGVSFCALNGFAENQILRSTIECDIGAIPPDICHLRCEEGCTNSTLLCHDGSECTVTGVGYTITNAVTWNPTVSPTTNPTIQTETPTTIPTSGPTKYPTQFPTKYPSRFPSTNPSQLPTKYPTTHAPTKYPTNTPTQYPTTNTPTSIPTFSPIKEREQQETTHGSVHVQSVEGENTAKKKKSDAMVMRTVAIIACVIIIILCVMLFLTFVIHRKKMASVVQMDTSTDIMDMDNYNINVHVQQDEVDGVGDDDGDLLRVNSVSSIDDNDIMVNPEETMGNYNVDGDEFIVEEINTMGNGNVDDDFECKNNTLGEGVGYNINESSANELKTWLNLIGVVQYFDVFVKNGFDSLEMLKEINDMNDLSDIGITLKAHQLRLINQIKKMKTET